MVRKSLVTSGSKKVKRFELYIRNGKAEIKGHTSCFFLNTLVHSFIYTYMLNGPGLYFMYFFPSCG